HEKDNPQPIVRTVDGEVVLAGHAPQTRTPADPPAD
ncbi:hypothetical protein LCGC14_2879280, partial [marine sediment metagenome]